MSVSCWKREGLGAGVVLPAWRGDNIAASVSAGWKLAGWLRCDRHDSMCDGPVHTAGGADHTVGGGRGVCGDGAALVPHTVRAKDCSASSASVHNGY